MDQQTFDNLYNSFKSTSRSFRKTDWDNSVRNWNVYKDKIINNTFTISDWIKPSNGGTDYLPNFLDNGETFFGHARIGNYDQVMIYLYTGKDANRKGKYINTYSGATKVNDNIGGVQNYFDAKILPLLKEIVGAQTFGDVVDAEKDPLYEAFRCKQILRKMTVLMSVAGSTQYNREVLWMYNEQSLQNLAEIFGIDIDDDDTFFTHSKRIFDEVKRLANITSISQEDDYIKLYDFLWSLGDPSLNTKDLFNYDSPNIIFNGAPGTGKTYGIKRSIEILSKTRPDDVTDPQEMYIQFHPTYSYQDFIEGIKPMGIVGNNINLQLLNGSFKQFCIDVKKKNEEYYQQHVNTPGFYVKDSDSEIDYAKWPRHYFVVDEINRGNISKIFGETFTLLEPDYRDYKFDGHYSADDKGLVSTPLSGVISSLITEDPTSYLKLAYKCIDNDNNKVLFGIPFNIHFIGAMNDVDRSIDAFDLALRRRFKWIEKYCDYEVIKSTLLNCKKPKFDGQTIDDYIESCKSLNEFICGTPDGKDSLNLGKTYQIGHAFFTKISTIAKTKNITKTAKEELFNTFILGTLKEYIRQVKDESEIDNYVKMAKEAFGIK